MNALEFIISCLFVYAVIHIHRKHGMAYFKMLFKEFGIFVIGFFIITFLLFMAGILIFK
nr:MAG TPA: hypothetical protein [Inoviridae sp.]